MANRGECPGFFMPRWRRLWHHPRMVGLAIRLGGVLVCAVAWWWLTSQANQKTPEDSAQAFEASLPLLAAQGVLIVAAILLAKPIAGWVGDLTANLFMPGARHDGPQPMYSIPEGRMAAEDYAGALEAYAELAAAHPSEIVPHLRMMEIWLRVYRDLDAARQIHANAMQTIKGRRSKQKFDVAARVILAEAEAA